MTSRSTVELAEVAQITVGPAFKSEMFTDDPRDIRLLRGANVGVGKIKWDLTKRWPEDGDEGLRRYRLGEGDIILAMDRPWLEAGLKVATVRASDVPALLVQRVARLRAKPSSCQGFIQVLVRTPEFREYLRSVTTGSAVPHISAGDISKFRIEVPDVDMQRRIAAVVQAFDELIEINERRIELLENLARSLYREWFVHFRFPGHKEATTNDESRRIPSGWERVSLSDLVTTQYGYTATAVDGGHGPKYLRGMDINKRSYVDWSQVPNCEIEGEKLEKFLLREGDVCVIRMADPGKVGIVEAEVEAVFASYLVRLRAKDSRLRPYLLFYFLSSPEYQDWITGSSTGSTRKSASAAVLTEPQMLVPTEDLVSRFESDIAELRRELNLLVDQNAELIATRDLLLPRLVTGQLDISDVDLGILTPAEAV